MPKKYHIHTQTTPPRFHRVGKYTTVQFQEECAGSCRDCVKKKCIYNIYDETRDHLKTMQEPEYLYNCESCLRCVQDCVKETLMLALNPDYAEMGDDYWTPDIISTTWDQAEKGAVPVSGAGYRGRFVGPGFDSMWTDMSEIVRPTRDGIHGREYINTLVQLSRRPLRLEFKDGELLTQAPVVLEIPLPVIFEPEGVMALDPETLETVARAAHEMGTLMLVSPENYTDNLRKYAAALMPVLTAENYQKQAELIKQSKMVELAWREGIEKEFDAVRKINPDVTVAVGLPLDAAAADKALRLAEAEVDTIHFRADSHGMELGAAEPRHLKDLIREVHIKLIETGLREAVNLVFSGGIALAEHMAKAIICGADAVTVDRPLLVALECRLCQDPDACKKCPVRIGDFDLAWGSQRLLNLMGAWRNQLLEVMGAMGIREVRRLRGEIGRSMWFEDLEREAFEPIFGPRKVKGLGLP
jgi:ferredoxin